MSVTSRRRICAGFDAIVHLAALSNDPLGDLDPSLTEHINGDGTLRVARAAREAGVRRFVFASSCSMYGASGTDDALDEERSAEAAHALRGVQGARGGGAVRSRRAGLRAGLDAQRDRVRSLTAPAARHRAQQPRRVGAHDGADPAAERRDGVAAARARARRREDRRSRCSRRPRSRSRGEAFNVGTDEQNYLVRELAEVLAQVTGCEIEIAEGSSADSRSYRVDFSKLARAFPDLALEWNAERGAQGARRCLSRGRSHVRGLRRQPLHPPAPTPDAARSGRARRRPSLALAGRRLALPPGPSTIGRRSHPPHRPLAACGCCRGSRPCRVEACDVTWACWRSSRRSSCARACPTSSPRAPEGSLLRARRAVVAAAAVRGRAQYAAIKSRR